MFFLKFLFILEGMKMAWGMKNLKNTTEEEI